MPTSLTWESPSHEFRVAPKTQIVALYQDAKPVNQHSSRVRRLAETVLGKKIAVDGEREYRNQCFAWENFNSDSLRVPEPIRYFVSSGETKRSSGYLIMEFLQGTPMDSATDKVNTETVARVARAIQHLHEQPVDASKRTPGSFTSGHTDGFPWGLNGIGSFRTLHDLESALNTRLQQYARGQGSSNWMIDLKNRRLAFCHMDLALRNILVLQDGPTAIVDWMTLAVYPQIFETASLSFLAKTVVGDEKAFLEAVCKCVGDSDWEEESRMLSIVQGISTQYFF